MRNGVGQQNQGEKNDTQPVSVRLPLELVELMDKRSEEWNSSRSKIITKSVAEYVFSKKCLVCGIENPGAGVICSVCGQPLDLDEKLTDVLHELKADIISESGLPVEMPGGFEPCFHISSQMKDRVNRYFVDYTITSPDGDVLIPLEKKSEFPISQDAISKRLEQKEYSVVLSNGKKMRVIFEEE